MQAIKTVILCNNSLAQNRGDCTVEISIETQFLQTDNFRCNSLDATLVSVPKGRRDEKACDVTLPRCLASSRMWRRPRNIKKSPTHHAANDDFAPIFRLDRFVIDQFFQLGNVLPCNRRHEDGADDVREPSAGVFLQDALLERHFAFRSGVSRQLIGMGSHNHDVWARRTGLRGERKPSAHFPESTRTQIFIEEYTPWQ